MALWKKTQNAFTAGQLDAFIMGRQDVDRYDKGATKLENFFVRRQGCITKRRGTDFIADLDGLLGNAYSAEADGHVGEAIAINKIRLIPVVNDDNGRYVIISGGYGFVASRHGVLMRDGSHVETIAPYVGEDEDGIPVRLDHDTETYDDDSLYPYRFAVPYMDNDLASLCVRQSGDTLFIAHRNYKPSAIKFDTDDKAHFDYLVFDNLSWGPPVIVNVHFEGQDAPECEHDFTGLESHTHAISDTKTCTVNAVEALTPDESLGTIISAGQTGPNVTEGPDQDYSAAATWSYTYEKRDPETGKKTTTVVTKSATNAISSILNSSQSATGMKSSTMTATSSAATTSPMVMKKIRYCATYVKDGKESRPSPPFEIEYCIPWQNSAIAFVEVDKGENVNEPELYNIYKDNGSGFGLVGTFKHENNSVGTFEPVSIYNSGFGFAGRLWVFEKAVRGGRNTVKGILMDSNPTLYTDDLILNKLFNNSTKYIYETDFAIAFQKAITIEFDTPETQKKIEKVVCDYGLFFDNSHESRSIYAVLDGYTGIKNLIIYTKNKNDPNAVEIYRQVFSYDFTRTYVCASCLSSSYSVYFDKSSTSSSTGYFQEGAKTSLSQNFNQYKEHVHRFEYDLTNVGIDFENEYITRLIIVPDNDDAINILRSIRFGDLNTLEDSFQDDYITPDMTLTPPVTDKEEHFAKPGDYPACVGMYEQRLVFASTAAYPSTIWFSRIADLYNFTAHESIREDDAMELTLAATEFPRINNLIMGRDLMMFADGGEWIIKPVSGNALTYKTASAKMQSAIGTSRTLEPVRLNDEVIVAERNGMHLRSSNYSYSSDSYKTTDISILAQDIFMNNPVVSMAYKQHPDSVIECVLADGTLATLVYMPEQDVIAWSVQTFPDGWKARQIVTPRCIMNGTTEMMILMEKEGHFQMWKVRDDLNTGLVRDEVTMDACRFHDCMAGEQDRELRPGMNCIGFTENGEQKCVTGYLIDSHFVSVRPEPAQGMTAQFEIKNATESEIRVIRGSRFRIKPYKAGETAWQTANIPPVSTGPNGRLQLYEQDVKKVLVGTNNRDGRIHLEHREPWPLTVLSLSTTYQIQYENEPPQEGGVNGAQ